MNNKIFGVALVATLIVTIFNATSVISLKNSQQTAAVYSSIMDSVRPTTGSPSPSGLTVGYHCRKTGGSFLAPDTLDGTVSIPGGPDISGTYNGTVTNGNTTYDCTLTFTS